MKQALVDADPEPVHSVEQPIANAVRRHDEQRQPEQAVQYAEQATPRGPRRSIAVT